VLNYCMNGMSGIYTMTKLEVLIKNAQDITTATLPCAINLALQNDLTQAEITESFQHAAVSESGFFIVREALNPLLVDLICNELSYISGPDDLAKSNFFRGIKEGFDAALPSVFNPSIPQYIFEQLGRLIEVHDWHCDRASRAEAASIPMRINLQLAGRGTRYLNWDKIAVCERAKSYLSKHGFETKSQFFAAGIKNWSYFCELGKIADSENLFYELNPGDLGIHTFCDLDEATNITTKEQFTVVPSLHGGNVGHRLILTTDIEIPCPLQESNLRPQV
jgi:hypothetical protein